MTTEAEMIASFIAERGVTRCPPVFLLPTEHAQLAETRQRGAGKVGVTHWDDLDAKTRHARVMEASKKAAKARKAKMVLDEAALAARRAQRAAALATINLARKAEAARRLLQLAKDYVDLGSISRVAEKHKMSHRRAREQLRKAGVVLAPQQKVPLLPRKLVSYPVNAERREAVRRLYVDEGKSICGTAKEIGAHTSTVRDMLVRMRIKMRPPTGADTLMTLSRQKIVAAFYNSGWSTTQCRQAFGLARTTVDRALRCGGAVIRPAGATGPRCGQTPPDMRHALSAVTAEAAE